jgi:hypothetical protein
VSSRRAACTGSEVGSHARKSVLSLTMAERNGALNFGRGRTDDAEVDGGLDVFDDAVDSVSES